MSIITNIIKKFNKTNSNKPSKIEYYMADDVFYIPEAEVLQKVNKHEPLTNAEINQYLNYIYNNYYVSDVYVDKINEFASDWCKYKDDLKALKERELDAQAIIAQSLSKGEDFDIVYALWLSKAIYVDEASDERKRLIEKSNCSDISVKNGCKYPQVIFNVKKLHQIYMDTILQKQVANNL